jgi:hypothetical protein
MIFERGGRGAGNDDVKKNEIQIPVLMNPVLMNDCSVAVSQSCFITWFDLPR